MQTNSAVEQNKNFKWSDSPWHQSQEPGIHTITSKQVPNSIN